MSRSLTSFKYLLLLVLFVTAGARAQDEGHKLLIADPFIELHTGPGRGYPIFHVVERGREVVLVKRRTDWFQLRTEQGVEGWASRAQMVATLEPTGEPLDLQEPARENYMSRRWQGGVMGGDFGGASLVSAFGGYAFSDNLSIELTLNHILGEFSNGYSVTVGLMHLFAPEWRISPYFTLGAGVIHTDPQSSLVQSLDRDDQIGYIGGGLQFYLTRRFMLRSEYRNNIVFTSRNDNEEVDEWKYLGFAFFFLSLLAVTALPGCSILGDPVEQPRRERPEPVAPAPKAEPLTGEPDQKPIIDPQVERREIKRSRIDTEDFELGAYVGVLSIEDFESNVVYGARLAYHLTEDFFLEGTVGQSRAGRTSYENLSGSADLLLDDDRDYTYYALSMGWNALPGEVFVGKNRAYNSAFYLIAGIGSTTFAGDDRFTVNGGFGYRVLPTDWIAVHFDVRDHIFDIDLLGEKKIVNNLEAHLGLSIFF